MRFKRSRVYYPLANEVAKGYSNAIVCLKKHDDVSIEKLNKGNAKHGVSPRIKI
jgi:hypothetical protein